jgi:hypothetical protein
MVKLSINTIKGLTKPEEEQFRKLVAIFNQHQDSNNIKTRYYEGHIPLSEVNLGIALPTAFQNLKIDCNWGSKAVDVLASRSMFDGFVSSSGDDASELEGIVEDNRLVYEYMKACRDELKYGCTFATLTMGTDKKAKVRFHSPETAAAMWDGVKGRIGAGFAIIDTAKDSTDKTWKPSVINYYTENAIIVLVRSNDIWIAKKYPQKMGRPLMEALIWNSTTDKPFGRSRLKSPIRNLMQSYVRTIANATIGLEFATSPQKYLLGVTDDQFDSVVNAKFQQYVGSIIAATTNPEYGTTPTFGQLPQGNIQPHVDMIRIIATQFGAATGLNVTDVGIVNDANPTSSDAIEAQTKTLIAMAQQLNEGNGESLKVIGQMTLAMQKSKSLDELTEEEKAIIPHFKNPAMPSVAVTTDAALKIASVRTGFASTDVFLEMIGFSQADVRRIRSQEQKARGLEVLKELE